MKLKSNFLSFLLRRRAISLRKTLNSPLRAMAACWCVLGLAFIAGSARAEVTSVTVEWQEPIGPFAGKEYAYFEGTMSGSVARDEGPDGIYEVPIQVTYPIDGGNGVGFVDPPNSGLVHLVPSLSEERHIETLMQWTRTLADDWLFEEGYTYVTVQWDKLVTDKFGSEPPDGTMRRRLVYGTIEEAADGYEILKDAARWLKAPTPSVDGVPAVQPVDYAVYGGYSQTTFMARVFIDQGHHKEDNNTLIYDGFLFGDGGGFLCWSMEAGPAPCPEEIRIPDAGEAKILAVGSQEGSEGIGFMGRDDPENPRNPDNYRRWEIAGTSHIPGGLLDLDFLGHPGGQNPADPRPVYRAAIDKLKTWMQEGEAPENSPFIEGEIIFPEDGPPELVAALDDDGNVLGGIRLPFMPREIDGEAAGAPLGTYFPRVEEDLPPGPAGFVFVASSGKFEPFSREEFLSRYPTVDDYLDRVAAAADAVHEEGFILEADREAYANPDVLPAFFAVPSLRIVWEGNNVVISWEGADLTLERADELPGEWTAIEGAMSPHIAEEVQTRFFRLTK
jgi:hypothetical protein